MNVFPLYSFYFKFEFPTIKEDHICEIFFTNCDYDEWNKYTKMIYTNTTIVESQWCIFLFFDAPLVCVV